MFNFSCGQEPNNKNEIIVTDELNYKMELVTPGIGLMFWTVVIFTLLLILLKKFAWGPILESVDNRNKNIEDALAAAENAKKQITKLLEKELNGSFFRVSVEGGGCSGFKYNFSINWQMKLLSYDNII